MGRDAAPARAGAVAETEPGAPRAVAASKPEPARERRWVSAESYLEALDSDRASAPRDYLSNRRKPGPWVRA